MHFKLCNAPSTFQKLMHLTFADIINQFVTVYHNILVYSETKEEHLAYLGKVFEQTIEFQLCCKLKKNEFSKTEITYLGHRIGGGIVSVDPSKTKSVKT